MLLFILLNVANVIIQTIKSLCTIKCGKTVAALVNAVAYALYTYVIFYTTMDGIELWQKAAIVGAANLVGVFVVKCWEEKTRKARLWKVELALPYSTRCTKDTYLKWFEEQGIPCNMLTMGDWTIYNCYCSTKEQTKYVKGVCKAENGKISAYESQPNI